MNESLLEFPCDFPLKIMGKDSPEFQREVHAIVARHIGDSPATNRPSRDGKYVAMSFMLQVDSREQLDALYQELSDNAQVLFVL